MRLDGRVAAVTGGSGGGVLTCWMIGHTTRFRAAVTSYPVINWYSFVLTSDIGNWTVNHWFPGFPWDHVEHYEKRSLLSVVKNVKTPTMVLTGEADYRTPMSDSEQYYQALKLLGVESVLVRVPDEPHGIQVRPSHHRKRGPERTSGTPGSGYGRSWICMTSQWLVSGDGGVPDFGSRPADFEFSLGFPFNAKQQGSHFQRLA